MSLSTESFGAAHDVRYAHGVYFTRLVIILVLLAASLRAQDELPLMQAMRFLNSLHDSNSPKPGFTSISEVNRIFATPGSAEREVKFSGVVIQSVPSQRYVIVQSGRHGILLYLAEGLSVPALGEEVEVVSKVKFVAPNGDTSVRPTEIRVVGKLGLPPPQRPKLAEIRTGRFNRQAVEVEAVVLDSFVKAKGDFAATWLLLSDDDGTCLAGVYEVPEGWNARQWIGKRIRFRGVGMPGSEFILRCSTPEDVTVLGDAAAGERALAPFTSVKALRDYGVERSRVRQYPVLLRAVTTFVHLDRNRFFIHDGKHGTEVRCRPDICPQPGDEVLVQGIGSPGGGAVYITGWNVEVLAKGRQATPQPWGLEPLQHNDCWGEYLETEAVVIHVQTNRQTGAANFYVVQNGIWMRLHINVPPPAPPGGWWGAKVRVRGALVHDGRLILWSNGGRDLEVVSPGFAEPFGAPLASSAGLRQSPLSASRVRVKGTVLSYDDGWIFLRDETGAVRSDTATHFEPSATHTVLPNFVRWPSSGIKPGDVMELAGSPMEPHGGLRYSTVRVLESGAVPPPRNVALRDAATGVFANDLVTLRGRLVGYSSGFVSDSYSPKRWREALELDSDGTVIEVVYETPSSGHALAQLAMNDLIEATGIVRPENGAPAFRLRARKIEDVRSLGPDPAVMRGKIIRIGIVASLALAAALGWVFLTRRTVTLRTAQLAAANKQLDVALAQEREIGELKSRFVSLVSHEFRTPLGVTMSAVELLRHYRERLPAEELDQLLGDIHSATVRMSAMMEQVLLLGRAEAGKLGFQKSPIILEELTDKLRDETLSASGGKCPLRYVVENDVSGASGDEALLRHIFSNLLSNAVKYSAPASPVDFRVARIGKNAVFTVKDSGIGIPEKDQARLFEAFHRAGNVGEREGTGLGLLIVKRCVDLHGGTISVVSAEGEGTTFVVTLPLFEA
jgi:signal transduction histidine kinase